MPFAAAQIGLGFRNEIAPRNGLLRVREFCMAEIEHFVDPNNKTHPKFANVANNIVTLFPAEAQLGSGRTISITIGEAVSNGLINNQTLGYFIARTQIFVDKIGIDSNRVRFRQHLRTEMAHYATDCWDLEILLVYGWTECAGHADRSCYDLEQHSKKTNIPLLASIRLNEPIFIEKLLIEPNKKLLGPKFKNNQKIVINLLENANNETIEIMKNEIDINGSYNLEGYEITKELVTFSIEKKTIYETKYTPSVIEPSYGIGRILYSLLEHSFTQRNNVNDEQRCVMSFKPCVAPIKVGIYRLINNSLFDSIVNDIHEKLQRLSIANKVDSSSGTVGRRYARSDELGIPFGITIDFQTLLDNAVTLRERDSMAQVRIPIARIIDIIQQLIHETITWNIIITRFPLVALNNNEDDDDEESTRSNSNNEKKEVVKAIAATATPTVVEHHFRSSFSRPNPLN